MGAKLSRKVRNCTPCCRVQQKRKSSRSSKRKSRRLDEEKDLLGEQDELVFTHPIYIIDNLGQIDDFYALEDEKIGEGSFGRVCKCTNRSTGTVRAVKILQKVRRKSQLLMIKNELATLKMLDNPYIVKIYEHFEDDKYLYIVMEHCAGMELFDRLLQVGHFTENQSALMMQQIFRGVYYMHNQHVVHRDLKIENFMLANPGPVEANIVKIIDFGFARQFYDGQVMHTKCGAPYYVSPQLLAGKYTQATDMWTLGVIMYILLCGYPPFFGDSDAEILSRVRTGNFTFSDSDWRHTTEKAKDLISRLLRMDEGARCTAKDAMKDEWVELKAPALKAPLKPAYFENMRKYATFSKLKKASLQIIVWQLEPEVIKPLIECFQWLDETGEGLISADEIEKGMHRAGWDVVDIPEDLNEMADALDEDGSGEIGLTEFAAAVLDMQVYTQEEVCWAAFRIFDQNGDGQIGVSDLHQILNNGQQDEVVDKDDVKALIALVDEDGDRRVSFAEFMKMMRGSVKKSPGRAKSRRSTKKERECSPHGRASTSPAREAADAEAEDLAYPYPEVEKKEKRKKKKKGNHVEDEEDWQVQDEEVGQVQDEEGGQVQDEEGGQVQDEDGLEKGLADEEPAAAPAQSFHIGDDEPTNADVADQAEYLSTEPAYEEGRASIDMDQGRSMGRVSQESGHAQLSDLAVEPLGEAEAEDSGKERRKKKGRKKKEGSVDTDVEALE
eukprot:TRINITY_DN1599_c0_g1_i1.p1 TRINITY_DN1599_c0_g1~~TRINITY_DN1599_c0_g1_i1.p1  ORF type:complete len:725 (-),score=184.02 TRINITY_DN1599_c0_g1_i1:53-2227(-)